ncbi:MAG TPA: AI-2E family transporter [Actinomycetota bacterium]|nr:AI-2E family transporter [Actinomycetota bacterium]
MSTPAPPRLPAGERLRRAGMGAWALIGLLIVAAAAIWALFKISIIFPPLVIALIIIYALNPIVSRLENRGVRRGIGAVGSYIVIAGLLTALGFALTPLAARQIETFQDDWPVFRDRLVTFVDDSVDGVNERLGTDFSTTQFDCLLGSEEIGEGGGPSVEQCDEATQRFREFFESQSSRLTDIGTSVIGVLLWFVIGPLIALYLLMDLPQLQRDMLNLVPNAHKDEAADLGGKIGRAVGGFFRGQLLVAFLVGLMSAIGFAIIGLPFWFVIGAIAGFFNLIPLVGPFIGGGIGFVIGTVYGGVGLGIKAAVVEIIVQQIDNHFLSPNVMKRTVQIHPVTVMLSLLAGGALAGFWGILLAVPAVAVGKLVLGHLWATRVLGAEVAPYAGTGREPPSVIVETQGEPDEESTATRPEATPSSPSH